jgi:putative transposase
MFTAFDLSIARLDQHKSLTSIRRNDPEGCGADPVTMGGSTLQLLDNAFSGFFGRVKRGRKVGFPRFKPRVVIRCSMLPFSGHP